MSEHQNDLAREGVVRMRAVFSLERMAEVRAEYEAHDALAEQREAPKGEPIVVYWTHALGERKRIARMAQMPIMWRLAKEVANIVRQFVPGETLRLLETIIFNKPPKASGELRWHQDVSYFPFEPNNQLAAWLPFDPVGEDNGCLVYALGSHLLGLRASTDLHSGVPFAGETREPIPERPDWWGHREQRMLMMPGDMLIHDGRTWHRSGPNTTENEQRRGLSLRFLVGNTYYKPRPGSAAAFMKQLDVKDGDLINDPAFPVL